MGSKAMPSLASKSSIETVFEHEIKKKNKGSSRKSFFVIIKILPLVMYVKKFSGGGGIRTPDDPKAMLVFKTSAINQALPPLRKINILDIDMSSNLKQYLQSSKKKFTLVETFF